MLLKSVINGIYTFKSLEEREWKKTICVAKDGGKIKESTNKHLTTM